MSDDVAQDRRIRLQVVIVALLVVAYGALGIYLNLALHNHIVYSHAAYIPIVLACTWWGRKGLAVTGLVVCLPFGFQLLGTAIAPLWSDVARIFFFLVVAVAVSELSENVKAGQRALRISEEKHRLIVEKALTGILVYTDQRILFANSRVGRMLGYPAEKMAAMSVWDLIAEEDLPRVRQLVMNRKAAGFSDLHYECRLVRRDGTRIWVDLASSVADFEGQPAVLVNLYDITDRKEAEVKRRELADLTRKQEEQLVHAARLAELGEMSAAVAHDLNQPLTGIRNFANNAIYMLEEGVGSPDELRENLRWITEQVQRASRIINQMRGMTRKSERQFAPLAVNEIIRESIEFLTPQLRLSGVEVSLELGADLPAVMGDRTRLEQVFLNLLTNARQAMEGKKERCLTVRTYADPDEAGRLVVEVEDTGTGFAADQSARLFEAFYSTKKPGQGTGLGLTICQRIIRDHGGAIRAEGESGKGAKFIIQLPAAKNDDSKGALQHHA
ncbi:MAG TPA: ATP-binding protein [Thermoguttaceae bacterium]|nr:ATP-binding protein [Thermoguttaceae bacterium]